MKRPFPQLTSLILAGRHCHPLGLLLAGLLLVSLGTGGLAGLGGNLLGTAGRGLHGSVGVQVLEPGESRGPDAASRSAPRLAGDEHPVRGPLTVQG